MTIKIKAPKAFAYETLAGEVSSATTSTKTEIACIPVRIIRESEWRKLMKLVREVEATEIMPTPLWDALQALQEKGK